MQRHPDAKDPAATAAPICSAADSSAPGENCPAATEANQVDPVPPTARPGTGRSWARRLGSRWRDSTISTAKNTVLLLRHPQQAPSAARRAFLRLWNARGGGFYGLGFAICFVTLEFQSTAAQISASASLAEFLSERLVEFLFRLAFDSLLNTGLAFIWPALLLNAVGGAGIIILLVGFTTFSRFVKPWVESRWPHWFGDVTSTTP